MNWQDEGFLLSKIKFRENANIVNVFTNTRGKVSGIIYGGSSRKIRNFLQISNKIFIIYSSKSENRLGYFKPELIEAISPKYFNDKKKTSALLSISSILNLLLPESQPYKKLYTSLDNLLKKLDLDFSSPLSKVSFFSLENIFLKKLMYFFRYLRLSNLTKFTP